MRSTDLVPVCSEPAPDPQGPRYWDNTHSQYKSEGNTCHVYRFTLTCRCIPGKQVKFLPWENLRAVAFNADCSSESSGQV